MQAVAKNSLNIDIRHQQIFLKSGRPRNNAPLLIDNQAAPIKNQLILSADEIAKSQNSTVIRRARSNHLLAQQLFAIVERRRRNIDQHLGIAGKCLLSGGTAGIPDIFADRNPKSNAIEAVHPRGLPRLEIAVFVKDAVIGQVGLVINIDQAPIASNRCGIVDIVLTIHKTENRSNTLRRLNEFMQHIEVGLDKPGLKKQIFGRIARDREFGKNDNMRPQIACPVNMVENFITVARKITHSDIDLR